MSSRKMKVAVVYDFFAHYRNAIVRELISSAWNHYVFAGDRKDPAGSGIEACDFADPSRFIYAPCHAFQGVVIQRGVIRLALSPKLDAIIYLGDAKSLSTYISALLARISGKRVLFWTHGWLRSESGLKSWIRCSFYHLGHGLLLYGQRAKHFGIAKGFKSRDLYVVYNSLDTQKQQEIRSRVTTREIQATRVGLFGHWNKPVIMCSGRMVASRRLDLLLEAASILQQEGRPIDVLLVGDGPQREQLETAAKAKGLSVIFYGACYEEEKLAVLMMSANATVVPGAVGLTAMHSLIYGTPVISHDDADEQMPEWEAIKPGINGQVFKKGDPIDLARVIKMWTKTNLPDESIRKRCYGSIDQCYCPSFQVQVIDAAVAGQSADRIKSQDSSNGLDPW
jgi:glycosyltransferase involved in cell wall biosynthesis